MAALLVSLALAATLVACGSSGGGAGSTGTGSGGSQFPDRGGGETTEPPPSVKTGRIVFRSSTGEECCVVVDPAALPGGALVVLDDLPVGQATIVVSYYAGDFGPAVEGITLTCTTIPPSLGRPCDPDRVASPSYESDPLVVNVVGGGQTNVGDLAINAYPFIVEFQPENDEAVEAPVGLTFTVADPVTNVEPGSVVLEVTVLVDDGGGFRPLTKRLPLTLSPCTDGSPTPCSPEGNLDLDGFRAATAPLFFLPGPVDVRILATNQGDPPRDVDFEYGFEVVP